MQLNYLLTSFSFILIHCAANAFPVTNEGALSQNTQFFKRSHSANLMKRKKHHHLDDNYYFDQYHDHNRKHNHDEYPHFKKAGFNKHNGYFNPRYSNVYPTDRHGTSPSNPYMNPYVMSHPKPIGSVQPSLNPTVAPNTVTGVTPAGLLPNPAPAAVGSPALSSNPVPASVGSPELSSNSAPASAEPAGLFSNQVSSGVTPNSSPDSTVTSSEVVSSLS